MIKFIQNKYLVILKNIFFKNFNLLKYFFFIISLIFIIDKSYSDYDEIKKIVLQNFDLFFYAFILSVILLNLINYRFFFFLKKMSKYSGSFLDWSKLFFQTLSMNFMISGSGSIFRAIQLKKYNINYSKFIAINYAVYLIVIITNFIFFIIFYYFLFKKINLQNLILIILSVSFLLTVKFHTLFFNFLSVILNLKKKYHIMFSKISNDVRNIFLDKKSILVFSFINFITFLLQGIMIFIISLNILDNKDIYALFILYFVVFYLNKIIFLKNFIGLNELFIGLITEIMGFLFFQGAIIQLIWRLNIYLGTIFNNVLYLFLKYKLKNKSLNHY